MTTETQSAIAVSEVELREFGCPYCGYRSGYAPLSVGRAALWKCGSEECGKPCCVLAEGVNRSPIGFGDFYPEIQAHPRRGTPSHGQPDEKPEGEGEFFRSRGVGLDTTRGCFVCGGGKGLRNNIAAFVKCKEAGERVVAMFSKGADLDYRTSEPDRVQVKIGACDMHLPNLKKLDELTREGVVTNTYISEARS